MSIKEGISRLVAVVGAAAVMSLPATALAQTDYPGGPPTEVQGETLVREPEVIPSGPEVLGETLSRGGEGLPVTGGDVAGLVVMGLGAIATGTVLVRRNRVRRS